MTGAMKWRAMGLHARALNSPETIKDLLAWLNTNGILTEVGQPYTGSRGVARAIACAYWHAYNQGDIVTADAIKYGFVGDDGQFAYSKY